MRSLPPHLQEQVRQALGSREPRRGNKYGVAEPVRRTFEGVVFDSTWEMQVYQALLAAFPKKAIQRQVPFTLVEKGRFLDGTARRAVRYVADFVVDGCCVLDAKGAKSQLFVVKQKLFEERCGVPLHLVFRRQFKGRGGLFMLTEKLKKLVYDSHRYKDRVEQLLRDPNGPPASDRLPLVDPGIS